jgi:hypothetical protein
MNFLKHLLLHVSHSLVVKILANGGVTCGMGEEGQWKIWVMHGVTKCVVGIEFI